MKLTREDLLEIHKGLHTHTNVIKLHNIPYNVSIHRNGCRQILVGQIVFIEQNQFKQSKYATLAREGARITWGMTNTDWICIYSPATSRELPFTEGYNNLTSIKQGNTEVQHVLV